MDPTLNGRPDLRVVPEHDWVDVRLPWLFNGSLPEPEARRVAAHLEACARCREVAAREQDVLVAPRVGGAGLDTAPHEGLARVMDRIETRERRRRWLAGARRLVAGPGAQRPLALAVAVQAVVLVVLSALLLLRPPVPTPPATYRALSATRAAVAGGATLRLVLEDGATLGDVHELLAPLRGRLHTDPDAPGIFTVDVEESAVNALIRLRADPRVRFVEEVRRP